MKKLLLLICTGISAFGAGSVTQGSTPRQLGASDIWVLQFDWIGDASNGSVPAIRAQNLTQITGYQPIGVQFIPGTPSPTSGYSVTIRAALNGSVGTAADILGGSGASLSATAATYGALSAGVTPLLDTVTMAVTGNSVVSARGTVQVFFSKSGTAIFSGSSGGGSGGAVASVFSRTGTVVAANGDYTSSQVTNVPAGNIAAITAQAAINELDAEKQALGNYITSLTGDVTASGPGAAAATLATVNGNVGAFTNANITVNAKGLITAAANGSGGSGTVTVVGAGALTSTALVTGGGLQAIQTPAATATMDSSGNISTPGGISTGVGSGVAGHAGLGSGTAVAAAAGIVGFQAPASVSTPFYMNLPAAPATGLMLNTGTSDPSVISYVPVGTGVTTALGTAVSGSGGICLATGSACASSPGGIRSIPIPLGGINGGGSGYFPGVFLEAGGGGFSFTSFATSFGMPTLANTGTPTLDTYFWIPDDANLSSAFKVQVSMSDPSSQAGNGTVRFDYALQCFAASATLATPATNTANTGNMTLSTGGTLSLSTATTVATSGCSAGSWATLQIARNNAAGTTMPAAVALLNARITYTSSY